MIRELIDRLEGQHILTKEEFCTLIDGAGGEDREYLFARARRQAQAVYGRAVFVRGLIEFTSFCKNNCYYCGIRRGNSQASRYRLTEEEIMECCREGYALGFRTFVLQGGEDPWYDDEKLAGLVRQIKGAYPDCAVTLSVGEKSYETYKKWFDAGADRYLLRHETANPEHYARLHPADMSSAHRKQCLRDLKAIGYQTGCGIMVGSPWQTTEHLAEDMIFMHDLKPEMVGIGPFIPHSQTPFKDKPPGTLERTLILLAVVRLMLPASFFQPPRPWEPFTLRGGSRGFWLEPMWLCRICLRSACGRNICSTTTRSAPAPRRPPISRSLGGGWRLLGMRW